MFKLFCKQKHNKSFDHIEQWNPAIWGLTWLAHKKHTALDNNEDL